MTWRAFEKMKKLIVTLIVIVIGLAVTWDLDNRGQPFETIDELIGKNYEYAHKTYFRKYPESNYTINVKGNLNEFDGGILNKKNTLTDSIVHVFTWDYQTHKKTIWIGQTEKMESQVIDAVQYSKDVQF